MSLSYVELTAVVEALQPLVGSLLQGVFQPTRSDLLLELYRPGQVTLLQLHFRGPFCRLHPIDTRPANPKNAHGFQQLCRKSIRGVLSRLTLHTQDRVVELGFSNQSGDHTLVAELIGPRGNLLLLDRERSLLGSAFPLERSRELAVGQCYLPPIGESQVGIHRWPDLEAEQLLTAIASSQGEAQLRHEFHSARDSVARSLSKQIKRLKRLVRNLERDMEKASEAQEYRKYADLIQIHLKKVHRGMSKLTVPDLFSDHQGDIEIPLRSHWSAQENMGHFYHQARRLSRAEDRIIERASDAEQELEQCLSKQRRLLAVETLEDLSAQFEIPLKQPKQARQGTKAKAKVRLPYWTYRARNGECIRVGKNSRDNDALTFRHSRGNDLWFHVRGRPGSHIVIPGRKGHSPPLDLMLDAAVLALKYSKLPDGEQAEVAYTQVKFVKKPKGANPGQVTMTQDKSLNVRLTAEHMAKLTKVEGKGK